MSTLLSKRLFAAVLSFVLLGFLGSCSKGIDGNDPGSTQTETTTLYGHITDESGASLSGVTVSADAQTAITDANGLFIIKNAKVPKGRAVILAKKAGYFNGARAETPGVGGVTKMELSMMQSDPTGSLSAASGGTVNVAGGAKLQFDAGSFTTASGASYFGTVSVAARYLHPNSPTFYKYFSGDNAGRTANNEDVSLVSCGVLRVKLTGASGEELKLAAGKEATITYPKPANPKAPTVMPLWYYDETLGLWKEDGSVTLIANAYVGKVSHFTDWNLDYKSDFGSVVLRVVCNGLPIEGVSVTLFGKDSSYFRRAATTGPDGIIRFKRFPSDQTIYLDIQASENNGLYYLNMPVVVNAITGQETNIGDIILNSPCPATCYGVLSGCDGGVGEALVTIRYGTEIKYIYTKSGSFAMQVPSSTLIVANAMDAAGNNGIPVDIVPLGSGEYRNIGSIYVCGPLKGNFIDLKDSSFINDVDDNSIAFSPDGSMIAVSSNSGPTRILIFETEAGKKIMEFNYSGSHSDMTLQFSLDNKRLLAGTPYSNSTSVFDISSGSGVLLTNSIPKLLWMALSDDGKKIVGWSNGIVNIYSADNGSIIKTLTIPTSPLDTIGPVAMGYDRSENAVIVFDAYTRNKLLIWSIDTDQEIRNFMTDKNIYSRLSSEGGEVVAISSNDADWSIYNITLGTKIAELRTGANSSGRPYWYPEYLTLNNFFDFHANGGGGVFYYARHLSDGSIAMIKNIPGSGMQGLYPMTVSRSENYLGTVTNEGVRIWKLK